MKYTVFSPVFLMQVVYYVTFKILQIAGKYSLCTKLDINAKVLFLLNSTDPAVRTVAGLKRRSRLIVLPILEFCNLNFY